MEKVGVGFMNAKKVRTPAIVLVPIFAMLPIILICLFSVAFIVMIPIIWPMIPFSFYKNYNIVSADEILVVKKWKKEYRSWNEVKHAVERMKLHRTNYFPIIVICFKDGEEIECRYSRKLLRMLKEKELLL